MTQINNGQVEWITAQVAGSEIPLRQCGDRGLVNSGGMKSESHGLCWHALCLVCMKRTVLTLPTLSCEACGRRVRTFASPSVQLELDCWWFAGSRESKPPQEAATVGDPPSLPERVAAGTATPTLDWRTGEGCVWPPAPWSEIQRMPGLEYRGRPL